MSYNSKYPLTYPTQIRISRVLYKLTSNKAKKRNNISWPFLAPSQPIWLRSIAIPHSVRPSVRPSVRLLTFEVQ